MSQQPKSAQTAHDQIALFAPVAGENLVVAQAGNNTLKFDFDITKSTFYRSENDLIIEGENGGKLTLDNFFAVGQEGTLPQLVLEDGTVVESAAFLKAQSPNLDIATAAGPAQSSSSSGAGDYDDSTGSLLGGTDRLGSLGTDQWGSQTGAQTAGQGLLQAPLLAATTEGTAPAPTPTPGPIPVVHKDDDNITVDSTGTVSSLYVFGDSLTTTEAQSYGTRLAMNNTEDEDTISVTVPAGSITPGYIAGGNVGGEQVWGNDTITVNAERLEIMRIDGGLGNDSITINAYLSGSGGKTFVGGDSWQDMTNGKGGNDTMTLNGSTSLGLFFGGDAARDMTSVNAVGGNDTITMNGTVTQANIGGDAGRRMENGAKGGDDLLVFAKGVDNTVLGGDAGQTMNGAQGGTDTITITGNLSSNAHLGGDAGGSLNAGSRGGDSDSITVDGSIVWSHLGGDGGGSMDASFGGKNDNILITGNVAGSNSSTYSRVGGDVAGSMTNGSIGGAGDTITINGDVLAYSSVGGDAAVNMTNSTGGDGDVITIKGAVMVRMWVVMPA